jgi:iron(III) transport system substrate-binding protein
LFLAGLTGCPPQEQEPIRVSVGSGNSERQRTPAEILELAKAEGELDWYTSLSERDAETFLSQFREKYPFIRTHLVRGGSFTIAEQVLSEVTSGRVQADVLHLLDPATFVGLRNQAALLYYDSPEARDLPAQYQDPGYWVAMRAVTLGIAYDPHRLRKEATPQHWQDLLQPRFRGTVGLKDAETAGAAYALVFLLRERYGTDYLERLGAQAPKIYKNVSQMQQALVRGEIAVAAGDVGFGEGEEAAPPADLTFVWPQEGVPMMVGPVAVLAGAPHPNCARLFEDFLLSLEGQRLVVHQLADYSLRSTLGPPAGRLALAKLRLVVPTAGWADYAAKRDLLRKEFSDLMGVGGE